MSHFARCALAARLGVSCMSVSTQQKGLELALEHLILAFPMHDRASQLHS